MNLEEKYIQLCNKRSDINEHLPTIKDYSSKCDHVTEMGVRWVVSTYAFMMGRPKTMVSIDLFSVEDSCKMFGLPEISTQSLYDLAKQEGIDYKFIVGDTRAIEIEPTDLLFIDTLHNYDQLKKELEIHSDKVRKYIMLHDTTTFEFVGEVYGDKPPVKGLKPAIEEFLQDNPNWRVLEKYTNNNGLTILERV
jgi:hypothetical protein